MDEYLGQPCPVCGEPFAERDDVVVCPDCGTPCHRACWKEKGVCVNTALHESGGSWLADRRAEMEREEADKRAKEKALEEAIEERLREENGTAGRPAAGLYDGVRLNPDDPCCGFDPNEKMDGATVSDIADFVAVNRFYYLPVFRLMKKTGRRMSFNFICLFFPELYFANRKMWGAAFLAMIFNLLFNIPAALLYMERFTGTAPPIDITTPIFQNTCSIASLMELIFSVVCCFFANYMYYRFAVRRIRKIRARCTEETACKEQMKTAGGTSLRSTLLVLITELFCASGIIALIGHFAVS